MKEEIKAWLKACNHSRNWLAEEIGVRPRTVDNWLSSPQVIPEGKLKLIERLMQDDEAAERERLQKLQPTAQVYSLQVDYPMFRLISRAALAHQQTIEDWSVEQIERAARQWEQQQIHQVLDDDLKPTASTVTQPEAPNTPAPAADSPSTTTVFPQRPTAEKSVDPQPSKRRSS